MYRETVCAGSTHGSRSESSMIEESGIVAIGTFLALLLLFLVLAV